MLKKPFVFILLAFSTATFASDSVIQYSSYTGLLERLYDGFITFDEALSEHTMGIGTSDKVDGEVIIIEGTPFRVTEKGTVEKVEKDETTPYLSIASAESQPTLSLKLPEGTTYDELTETLLSIAENKFYKNYPHLVRIKGTFSKAKTRSVPKQKEPFPALIEIAKQQSIFDFEKQQFTMIGFWYPKYAQAFNPPEWHIHALNASRTSGGHVLDFETGKGVTIELWKKTSFEIHQPDTDAFAKANFDRDMSKDVSKVNRN